MAPSSTSWDGVASDAAPTSVIEAVAEAGWIVLTSTISSWTVASEEGADFALEDLETLVEDMRLSFWSFTVIL
jgi:hypothetical protein